MYNPITSESETLTVGATAVGFVSPPSNAQMASLQVLDGAIRFYVDGSTPTATTGHRAGALQVIELYMDEIRQFKAIRETATSAVVPVTFYSAGGPN